MRLSNIYLYDHNAYIFECVTQCQTSLPGHSKVDNCYYPSYFMLSRKGTLQTFYDISVYHYDTDVVYYMFITKQ